MKSTKLAPQRLVYIDALKAFAIILVIAGHVNLWGGAHPLSGWVNNFIYSFHMPLFFLLSGYTAYRADLPVSGFLPAAGKKARALLLPFFTMGLLYTVCQTLYRGQSVSFDLVRQFIATGYNYGYWFLAILFLIFIVYYAISILKKYFRLPETAICPLYLAAIAAVYLVTFRAGIDYGFFMSAYLLIIYLPFFLAGELLRRYEKAEKVVLHPAAIALNGAAFAAVLYWLQGGIVLDRLHFAVQILVAVPPVLFFYALFKRAEGCWRLMRSASYVGLRSLDIYLFHYFFLLVMLPQPRFFAARDDSFAVGWKIALFTLLILGCSLGVSLLVRRNRTLSLLLLGKKFELSSHLPNPTKNG